MPAPVYRPYQKAISEYLERINWNPSGPPVTIPATPVIVAQPIPVAVSAATNGAAIAAPAATVAVAAPEPIAALPAPTPASTKTVRERLADLKSLFDDGLLDEDEFKQRKSEIIKEL